MRVWMCCGTRRGSEHQERTHQAGRTDHALRLSVCPDRHARREQRIWLVVDNGVFESRIFGLTGGVLAQLRFAHTGQAGQKRRGKAPVRYRPAHIPQAQDRQVGDIRLA